MKIPFNTKSPRFYNKTTGELNYYVNGKWVKEDEAPASLGVIASGCTVTKSAKASIHTQAERIGLGGKDKEIIEAPKQFDSDGWIITKIVFILSVVIGSIFLTIGFYA